MEDPVIAVIEATLWQRDLAAIDSPAEVAGEGLLHASRDCFRDAAPFRVEGVETDPERPWVLLVRRSAAEGGFQHSRGWVRGSFSFGALGGYQAYCSEDVADSLEVCVGIPTPVRAYMEAVVRNRLFLRKYAVRRAPVE